MIGLLSGCSTTTSTKHIDKDIEKQGLHEVTYEELQDKLTNDKNFVLYIGRPDCGDCAEFEPILDTYLEENEGVYLYYLNIKSFRDASREEGTSQEEIDFYENMREELPFSWTPTIHHYVDGEVESTYTYLDEDYYDIEDEEKLVTKKDEFIDLFKDWMNTIYK